MSSSPSGNDREKSVDFSTADVDRPMVLDSERVIVDCFRGVGHVRRKIR